VISRKSDTTSCDPDSPLDAAIREWIVPALARWFLQLRSEQSRASFEKDGNVEGTEQNCSSEELDYAP
jgi:hypothetical protein